jgi:hypothetical protein
VLCEDLVLLLARPGAGDGVGVVTKKGVSHSNLPAVSILRTFAQLQFRQRC